VLYFLNLHKTKNLLMQNLEFYLQCILGSKTIQLLSEKNLFKLVMAFTIYNIFAEKCLGRGGEGETSGSFYPHP
jgi:hypothetical protein